LHVSFAIWIHIQDGAPAHTAKLAQNWIAANCMDMERPTNSLGLNLLDYRVRGAMRELYRTFQPMSNTID